MMSRRTKKLLLGGIFLLLLIIPLIVGGKYYYVGGDDLKLYYLFPNEYLQNYTFNIVSDNSLGGAKIGYYPVSEIGPFLIFILFLKKSLPLINTQYLMHGFNYAFGFLFFYLFLGFWISDKRFSNIITKTNASLFYVFSPLLIQTLYNHQLLPMYLVSIIPTVLFFFMQGIIVKRSVYTLLAALIYSIFGLPINNLPWTVGMAITLIPLFLWLLKRNPVSFLTNSVIFVITFVLLNIHSVYHLFNSSFFAKGLGNVLENYSSAEFIAENKRGILGAATLFSPLSQFLLVLDNPGIKRLIPYPIVNSVFIVVISFSTLFFSKIKSKKIKDGYVLAFVGFLIAWFSFSPNFGSWGPQTFLYIVTKFPFLTMFRNMFDKFALPLSFYYAFLFAFSLTILARKYSNKVMIFVLLISSLVTIYNGILLFSQNKVHEGTNATITGEFNDDYKNLENYLSSLKNASTIMWVPLTAPNYVSIEDKYLSGHYYSGLSPLRVLSSRADYSGRFAFMISKDIFRGDKILKLIQDKRFDDFAREIQRLNVKYIIVDHQVFPESMQSFLYDADRKYLNMQNEDFMKVILGKKLKDFGSRYSLFEINEKYNNDKLYLTLDLNMFPKDFGNLQYEKLTSSSYRIHIRNLQGVQKLVFLDPFYKEWSLYFEKDGQRIPFQNHQNFVVFDYANGWNIDPTVIKKEFKNFYKKNASNGIDFDLVLSFEPEVISPVLFNISTLTYVISFLIIFNWGITEKLFSGNLSKKVHAH